MPVRSLISLEIMLNTSTMTQEFRALDSNEQENILTQPSNYFINEF